MKIIDMKYIDKIGMTAIASCLLAMTSCSDYADYNSAVDTGNSAAGKTLYENISENPKLQGFASIINKAGLKDYFNASRYYTLWAPVDGSYDVNAILSQNDSTILANFVNQHMAEYSYLITGDVDKKIITLNDKHHTFTNTKFDDLDIVDKNLPSSNGIVHTIDGISEYRPNLYQYLDEVKATGNTAFVDYIQQYDEDYIDEKNSVPGPMVDGVKTYSHIVYKKRNSIFMDIMRADIADEDSSYTMFIPTDKAWNASMDRMRANYKYIQEYYYMDLTSPDVKEKKGSALKATTGKNASPIKPNPGCFNDSMPKRNIVQNLVFSNTNERNYNPIVKGIFTENDTIVSTRRKALSNVKDFIHYAPNAVKMSNGYARMLDSVCYNPVETYEPLVYGSIAQWSGFKKVNGVMQSPTYNRILRNLVENRDTLFDNIPENIKPWLMEQMLPEDSKYFSYTTADIENITDGAPGYGIALPNVLSTKYHIFVVVVPPQVDEPYYKRGILPMQLRFDISYLDADGTQKYERINSPGVTPVTKAIELKSGKIEVVELEFTFPLSYSGLQAYPSLFVCMPTPTSFTPSNKKKYEQYLGIEGVYLVPEAEYQKIINKK